MLKSGFAYRAGRNVFFRSLGHNQAAGSGLSPLLGCISLGVSRSRIYEDADTGRVGIALSVHGYNFQRLQHTTLKPVCSQTVLVLSCPFVLRGTGKSSSATNTFMTF